ncbi:hypothetical protein AYO48_01345 [Gaiella sp. SCGC AG-212-M14]|nr:hypothetical protein AYO48_01345 [Gaiella sp. SCGC AG-212-M14]
MQPILSSNNGYDYGCDYRTDTLAQPGLAAGAMYTALTCASVRPAAVADDLISSPNANNRCPREGHLVALVIAPGWDFHWFRKGRERIVYPRQRGAPVERQRVMPGSGGAASAQPEPQRDEESVRNPKFRYKRAAGARR